MTTSTSTLSIDDLRSRLTGGVLGPGDDGYDEARAILYDLDDRHPAAVAPASAQAVFAAGSMSTS